MACYYIRGLFDFCACEFGKAWDQGLTVLGVVETMTAKMAVV